MLAKANRVTAAVDYRRITRTGRRRQGGLVLAYGRWSSPSDPLRMGVIVARNVGNAVVRNRVRRRIKAVGWSLASDITGIDVVVRALPGSAAASWTALAAEVRTSVEVLASRQPAAPSTDGPSR